MEKHNKVFHNALLAGQYLIITGGGTGIGLETALQAAEIGAKGIAICGMIVSLSTSLPEC
jgi:short-subunit dehydrogenase involved in D-alanine esterification of teichoic acids